MQKKQLSEVMILYTFEPDPGRHFGYNLTALIDEKKAILIDTAFEHQALQVYKDLEDSGIKVEKVIISHFHDDHLYGLKVLPKLPVYGSIHFQETLDRWTKKEDHPYFIPTFLVENSLSISFGKHQVTLSLFPGHSHCGILVNISNQYVHIGDELLFSNKGEPLLPSIDGNRYVKRHFESLTKLIEYRHYNLIPSHGPVISGEKNIEREIANRIAYLRAILENSKEITFEEATKECDCSFLHSEWHKNVYR